MQSFLPWSLLNLQNLEEEVPQFLFGFLLMLLVPIQLSRMVLSMIELIELQVYRINLYVDIPNPCLQR